MDSPHRPRAARSAGALSARILLALASLVGAFTVAVVGAEPAGAITIERSEDEIVITSDRLHENQTHVTVIDTLRSDGTWTHRMEAHCTAATRKFVDVNSYIVSPSTGHSWNFYAELRRRVDSGEWDEWETGGWSPLLQGQWDEVLNDPYLTASYDLTVRRVA
jgi:hypothetical protein